MMPVLALTSFTSRGMPLLPGVPSWPRIDPCIRADKGKPEKKSSSNPPCVRAMAIAYLLLGKR